MRKLFKGMFEKLVCLNEKYVSNSSSLDENLNR